MKELSEAEGRFLTNFCDMDLQGAEGALAVADGILRVSQGDAVEGVFEATMGAIGVGSIGVSAYAIKGAKAIDGADDLIDLSVELSPEDAKKYLEFLENGSTAGLTPEELAGIDKLDELLALEKVEWDDVVRIRADVYKGGSEIPTAFRQTEFASSYDARINQTPSLANRKVQFVGDRGESLCVLKPPPDPELERLLNEAGVDGILYRNAVPDFSPVSRAEVEIDYMLGGNGANGNKARDLNFQQANAKLAEKLNESPELAQAFGMEAGNIKVSDIEKYRVKNDLTWHELNDGRTVQLVPSEINSSFGHLGGVGEINAGIYKK